MDADPLLDEQLRPLNGSMSNDAGHSTPGVNTEGPSSSAVPSRPSAGSNPALQQDEDFLCGAAIAIAFCIARSQSCRVACSQISLLQCDDIAQVLPSAYIRILVRPRLGPHCTSGNENGVCGCFSFQPRWFDPVCTVHRHQAMLYKPSLSHAGDGGTPTNWGTFENQKKWMCNNIAVSVNEDLLITQLRSCWI